MTTPAPLVVRTSGIDLPLVASPAQVAPILGRSDRSVRADCETGRIPVLPRSGGSGAHHRIPVAKLLDELGIPYEIVADVVMVS